MNAHNIYLQQEAPKTLLAFMAVILSVYLLVSSYEFYKKNQFQLEVKHRYGENHYKLRQMASEEILCRDSHLELCFCGHCS